MTQLPRLPCRPRPTGSWGTAQRLTEPGATGKTGGTLPVTWICKVHIWSNDSAPYCDSYSLQLPGSRVSVFSSPKPICLIPPAAILAGRWNRMLCFIPFLVFRTKMAKNLYLAVSCVHLFPVKGFY